MPEALIEFFVQFLTDEKDVVIDPFAGSNTTGSVAERLGRRSWLGIEAARLILSRRYYASRAKTRRRREKGLGTSSGSVCSAIPRIACYTYSETSR